MRKILPLLALTLFALSGCAGKGGQSPILALAPTETRQAFDALGQRTESEVMESERVIGTLAPGQAGYFLMSNGRPIIFVRSKNRPDWISVWMEDRTGLLVDIEGRVEFRGGRTVYVNPAVVPWRPAEEAKARELYAQVAAKLTGKAVVLARGWHFRTGSDGAAARQFIAALPEADQAVLLGAIVSAAPDSKHPVMLSGQKQPVAVIRFVDMGFSVIWPGNKGEQSWLIGHVQGGQVSQCRMAKPGDRYSGPDNLAMAYDEAVGQVRKTEIKPKVAHKPEPKVSAKAVPSVTPPPAVAGKKEEPATKAEVMTWDF